jgi:hypothetical protein
MLASEMIKNLVDLIAKHGDQIVWIDDNSDMFNEVDPNVSIPVYHREVCEDFHTFIIKAEVIS